MNLYPMEEMSISDLWKKINLLQYCRWGEKREEKSNCDLLENSWCDQ
jgi:hypothetical protein